MVLHRLDLSRHGADVEHHARPAVRLLRGLLQEWQEAGGHEVDLRDVGAVDVVPVLECGVLIVEEVLLHLLGGGGFVLEGLG